MITLFIDTSTDVLTVALFKDDALLDEISLASKEHSKHALVEIEKIYNRNNIKPIDTKKVMVLNGPGSFTGIRIGVTIAKIFAWACKINVIPISTLKAYAISNIKYDYYIPVIDARRNCSYASIYDDKYNSILGDSYIEDEHLINKIKDLNNVLIIGNKTLGDFNSVDLKLNTTRIFEYYKNDEGINPHQLNPYYLKKTEAEEKFGD